MARQSLLRDVSRWPAPAASLRKIGLAYRWRKKTAGGVSMKKAPTPSTVAGALETDSTHANSIKPSRFLGTDNPRYLRAIQALLTRPTPRKQLDQIAGCANGPALISELRDLGLTKENLPCQRINFIDRDGKVCKPGIYSFTEKGRRMIYAWLASRKQGGAE